MCAPKTPPPPDPRTTSAAQTGTNVATAVANAQLNNVNQITPYGNLNYTQSGEYTWTDPFTNKSYTVPKFTVEQTLSPEQQQLLALNNQADINTAQLAVDQSARLNDLLGTPMTIGNEATEARLFELGSKRLDPVFEQRADALRTDLVNRGIGIGSEAYNREMERLTQQQNDAYNQLLLQGRGQSVQEQLTERNQPINEITALLSGSQVSQPNFTNTNMGAIPTTDNAGIINANYQQQLARAQSQNSFNQSLMGGLFGLGAAGIGIIPTGG